MPYRVVCAGCGEVLERGDTPAIGQHAGTYFLPYYQRIRLNYNGKCPKCGKKLANQPIQIKIKEYNSVMRTR